MLAPRQCDHDRPIPSKSAFAKHRCLISADGWYEWIKNTKPKQPHYICRKDREPLFFAGIFAEREDGSLDWAIVTEPARGSAEEVHGRMRCGQRLG